MNRLPIILAIGIFFFLDILNAQSNKDCNDPLILCGNSPFSLELTAGIGESDTIVDNSCALGEFGSLWIELNVKTSGQLVFELSSASIEDDFDFVIYKLENGDCETKTIVRCMASGANVNQPTEDNLICLGATGLAFGETDIEEQAGCQVGDNNFLAPLEVMADEQYVLLINDFSSSDSAVKISFEGSTAELDCISTSASDISAQVDLFNLHQSLNEGYVDIHFSKQDLSDSKFHLIDHMGAIISTQELSFESIYRVDTKKLTYGIYSIILDHKSSLYTKRFLIIR